MIEVGNVYTTFPEDIKEPAVIQIRAVKHLAERGKKMIALQSGDFVDFDKDISLRVIQDASNKNVNERSALLHVVYGKSTLLLTADIGNDTQKYLVTSEGEAIRSDIMKSPHHGIENLRKDFLDIVQPGFVFFTHTKSNTKAMQATLEKRGIPMLFATRGVIHMVSDGERWYVEQLNRTKETK